MYRVETPHKTDYDRWQSRWWWWHNVYIVQSNVLLHHITMHFSHIAVENGAKNMNILHSEKVFIILCSVKCAGCWVSEREAEMHSYIFWPWLILEMGQILFGKGYPLVQICIDSQKHRIYQYFPSEQAKITLIVSISQ